jgi:AcrR family transcriptional regulator
MESPGDLRQWRLPRGRHGLPRELVERSQRERLLAAVVQVTAEKGYDSTTVGDILGEAGVGRESFYQLFNDKLDCMLAAHKILIDSLEERVRAVYHDEGPWPQRVRSAVSVTLDWVAADPETARFLLVEVSAIGPAFRPIFQTEFERFTKFFEAGIDGSELDPQLAGAARLAIGGMLARIYEEVVLGRTEELPSLLPDLTYGLLVPYLGEEQARAVAGAG